jgi:hypothetical protein
LQRIPVQVIGIQESPRPRLAEVVAGEFSDARQAVAQRAAMNVVLR